MKVSFPRYLTLIVIILIVAGIMALALSGYLNSVFSSALNPLISAQGWFSNRYLAIYEIITIPRDVATLRQQNAILENENSRLQTQIIQLEQQLREAAVLYSLLNFARGKPENIYIAAAVIGRDPSPFLQYIIIDKGSDVGLRRGMPIVTEQGLVGRVDAVISNAARVQLITDASSVINVVLKESEAEGVLTGSVTGDVTVEMISQDIILVNGDIILTSGLGGNYPSNILIGQVTAIKKLETDLFQSTSVQTAVDFNNLQAVLVITNFKPVDIGPLETN